MVYSEVSEALIRKLEMFYSCLGCWLRNSAHLVKMNQVICTLFWMYSIILFKDIFSNCAPVVSWALCNHIFYTNDVHH